VLHISASCIRGETRGRAAGAITTRAILLLFLVLLGIASNPAQAVPETRPTLSLQIVNDARWSATRSGMAAAVLLKAQVLLDRAGFSPGAIDARDGENFDKALRAFQQAHGLHATGKLDQAAWDQLVQTSNEPVLRDYTTTAADVTGPFIKSIPTDYQKMAKLDRLAYRSPRHLLAEKFHLSVQLLDALNSGKDLTRAGTDIVVANVTPLEVPKASRTDRHRNQSVTTGTASETLRAARVVVDKSERAVRVLGSDGALIAYYPATIGSAEKPAPSGSFEVRGVSYDPTYRYDPRYHFKGQHATRPVTVAPGPNNPVGLVWIELSAKSYGIHGTPDAEKISKTASHGCIRLTNWDALALAHLVHKGTPVDFIYGNTPRR
jgi:lipoprotein-anchoring transpeptidase ErfK/SrfK